MRCAFPAALACLMVTSAGFASNVCGYEVSYDCTKHEQAKNETVTAVFNDFDAAKAYAQDHKAKLYQVGNNQWQVEYQVEEIESYLFDGLDCANKG